MQVCLELEQKYRDSLISKFLHHAKKIEADHDVKTDGDNTDYWSSMQLEDGSFVDYNFHMMSEWDDPDRSWTCEVYSVDPPTEDNEYHSINMEHTLLLAFYHPETKKIRDRRLMLILFKKIFNYFNEMVSKFHLDYGYYYVELLVVFVLTLLMAYAIF